MNSFIPTKSISITKYQQRFIQIPELYPIPSNCLVDKTLTGIGATYAEITNPNRNSIIIMPNVAVIKCKQADHSGSHNTLAVWGKTKAYVIQEYLDRQLYPKKFLITPEAFKRLKDIVDQSGIDIFREYFLLVDESHKTIKDVGYRNRIVEPMKHFFSFEGKAFITATHLVPSDPRFIQNQFTLLKVKPEYDYRKHLDVIHVSNILTALKRHFKANPYRNYCLFVNSINVIRTVVEGLRIKELSNIYCSEESVNNLTTEGYSNVYSELVQLSKFNFFTSSFYNGLDINNKSEVDILIVTEAKYRQTAIDPLTDVPQIVGRFRTGKISQITHYYTTDKNIRSASNTQLLNAIELERTVYQAVKALKQALPYTQSDEFLENLLNQEIQRQGYSRFITDGETDYYKIDNFVNDERVKGYYKSKTSLEAAYQSKEQRAFHVHFKDYVLISDKEDAFKIRNGIRYSVENIKRVAETMNILSINKDSEEYKEAYMYFSEKAAEALQAFEKIGYQKMADLNFKRGAIRKAVIYADYITKRNLFPIIDMLHTEFPTPHFYSSTVIKAKITSVYSRFQMEALTRTAGEIEYFFHCHATTKKVNGQSVRGYMLLSRKQEPFPEYLRN